MKEDVELVRTAVYEELRDCKRCRVNDLYLLLKVYQRPEFKGVNVEPTNIINDNVTVKIKGWAVDSLPKPESISRCRRKFMAEGLFAPYDLVLCDEMKSINEWWGDSREL